MSTVRPPAAALLPVRDPLPGDEPGHKAPSPVTEDLNALDELPQGALVLLAQLQPLLEHPLKLSLAAQRSVADTRLANSSVDQTIPIPMKPPPVPASPALFSARLPLAARLPIAAQVPVQVPVASVPATPDRAGDDVLAEQKAPSSSIRLPFAVHTQVPDRIAVASPPWAADQAAADRPVKQETPQALPTQPLPLQEKPWCLPPVTRPAVPPRATPKPNSAPDLSTAKGAGNYLQVPFSKGDAVGLITVSKDGAERPEHLLLNPSSPLVFSHLSDSLAQAPDPRWRLTDQQGHESRHGHEQERPDEEAEEQSRQALRRRSQRGEQQT